MPKKNAGILLYRTKDSHLEIFLVHPGGPFWAKKDKGVWSIPKGEIEGEEDGLETAIRELQEETGIIATGPFYPLKPITQKAGKIIYAWAMPYDEEILSIKSNTFQMEWPPKSGVMQSFPEIDKAVWFTVETAMVKINIAQQLILLQLFNILNA